MNDACFCVCANVDGTCEFQRHNIQKARKQYKCCECGETINPGDKYEYVSGKWDYEFSVFKTCLPCMNIRDDLFCEGYFFTMVWKMLIEHLQEAYDDETDDWIYMIPEIVRDRFRLVIEAKQKYSGIP